MTRISRDMSLIADPWNDQEVEIKELENRIQSHSIRTANSTTCSHRSHSQWNDSSVGQARPLGGPVEIQPSVRIMKRDNALNKVPEKPDNSTERIDKTLEERERAYAEARRRILGDDADDQSNGSKLEETQPKRDIVPDKGRNNTERATTGDYRAERGTRRGKYRSSGRPSRDNGRPNRDTERKEETAEKLRPKPPSTGYRGGGYKKSNGYRGRGGGNKANQEQDRT